MSSVITKEIHVCKKSYSQDIVHLVSSKIENLIKDAPKEYTANKVDTTFLRFFKTVMYGGPSKVNQILSFDQYGPFYIAKVYDISASDGKNFCFIAYSIYDIFEYVNHDENKEIPYIFLIDSKEDLDYQVNAVDNPFDYKNETDSPERQALNENYKYLILFKSKGENKDISIVEMYCNPRVITVGNPFTLKDRVPISERRVGIVNLKKLDPSLGSLLNNEAVFSLEYSENDGCYFEDIYDKFVYGQKTDFAENVRETLSYCGENAYPTTPWSLSKFETVNAKGTHTSFVDNDGTPSAALDIPIENGVNTITPVFTHHGFINAVSQGTFDYGKNDEGIDQTQNQRLVDPIINIGSDPKKKTIKLLIEGKNLSDLGKWYSTNPNQKDSEHAWFALNLHFDKNRFDRENAYGKVKYNGQLLYEDSFDKVEGENVLTLWLKLDEFTEGKTKTISLQDLKGNEEGYEISVIWNYDPIRDSELVGLH